MDWYVDATDPDAPQRLKEELRVFFRTHASHGSDVDGAVLVAWELMTNVIRHAAGPMWVTLDWSEERPQLEVHDLGPGFELETALEKVPGPQGGFGLKLVSTTAQKLRAATKKAGGARVSVTLPLSRASDADRSYGDEEPQPGLPIAQFANDEGWIGRDTFLMAVAVNLAQNVAMEHGFDVASALINRVGRQVGEEMEKAYRAAHGIYGPLTIDQMADLFVGLKSAIEGDFYVIEATDERIVLGNRRCPFGTDPVRRAPALCQMTSAVFGGIAARNRRHARVLLDERIAVGDPGCRVVVDLTHRDAGGVGSERPSPARETAPNHHGA